MLSTYYKNMIADVAWVTLAGVSAPSELWLGYSTTAPAADGSNISEPDSTTGYERVSLKGKLAAAVDGVVTNALDVRVTESTADQGVITHFVIFDAQTEGNFLASGKLENSRTMEAQTSLAFPAGAIIITLEDKVEEPTDEPTGDETDETTGTEVEEPAQ